METPVQLVCPLCRGPLHASPHAYSCDPCARLYPIVCGIPDLRVLPDRWISIEDDRVKGRRLDQAAPGRTFAQMLDLYWSMTPGVPPELIANFNTYILKAASTARSALDELGPFSGPLLDLGCATGGLLIAAARRLPALHERDTSGSTSSLPVAAAPRPSALHEPGASSPPLPDPGCSTGGLPVSADRRRPSALHEPGCATGGLPVGAAPPSSAVGVDIAFRWLVIAKVRLREAGVEAPLICANAEHLPFPDDAFGSLTAVDLVEHLLDPAPAFRECRRVARPGGACYFSSNNRYSLLPEPHTGVWGLGWLPRPLQSGFARLAAGRDYRNISLRSAPELKRFARDAGFASWRLSPAPAPPGAPGIYNRMRHSPGFSRLLSLAGPRLQILCRK